MKRSASRFVFAVKQGRLLAPLHHCICTTALHHRICTTVSAPLYLHHRSAPPPLSPHSDWRVCVSVCVFATQRWSAACKTSLWATVRATCTCTMPNWKQEGSCTVLCGMPRCVDHLLFLTVMLWVLWVCVKQGKVGHKSGAKLTCVQARVYLYLHLILCTCTYTSYCALVPTPYTCARYFVYAPTPRTVHLYLHLCACYNVLVPTPPTVYLYLYLLLCTCTDTSVHATVRLYLHRVLMHATLYLHLHLLLCACTYTSYLYILQCTCTYTSYCALVPTPRAVYLCTL